MAAGIDLMAAPITQEKIDRIVSLYRDGANISLKAVGIKTGVSAAVVRQHVEAAGVFVREGPAVVPVAPAVQVSNVLAETLSPTDEDLGIGEPEAEADVAVSENIASMDTLTSSKAFQDAVAQAVAQAMAKLPAAYTAPSSPESLDWQRFMNKMGELTDSINVQKPGYQKPLTAEELASREQGGRKFFAFFPQIRMSIAEHGKDKAIALGLVPEYIVGEKGYYGSTAAGEMQFVPGVRIRLTTPPPEDFLPMNDLAGAIMQAQMQRLGEPTPEIGELVAQAMMRARGADPTYIAGLEDPVHADDATLVDGSEPVANIGPKRTMGTSVPELRATNTPFSPGSTPVPTGPIFAG